MAESKIEKTKEQIAEEKELNARKAGNGGKAAIAQKKISYPGKGSVGGYYYLKVGDKIPEFMKKDDRYKIAIERWFK